MNGVLTWLAAWKWWLMGVSLALSLASAITFPLLLIYMPADYFARPDSPAHWGHRHPLGRLIVGIAKNLLGALLILAGIVMLFTPGQGTLFMLIGFLLLDFPGKRAIERRFVDVGWVQRAINRLRARAGKPPLELAAVKDREVERS